MPVSIRVIERRLQRQELANLAELESWLKRMVNNAKEYYNKNSTTFEDAERVRKATSNWMVRYNPAYKKMDNYAATPIPIPPDYDVDAELAQEDMPTELFAAEASERPPPVQQPRDEAIDEDADGEDEEMPDADGDEDADGDPDTDAEADDDAEEDDGEASQRGGSSTRIVLKRRGAARSQTTEDTPSASFGGDNKGDGQWSEVPYQGLTFQQAQEKIIDTLQRHTEDGYVLSLVTAR